MLAACQTQPARKCEWLDPRFQHVEQKSANKLARHAFGGYSCSRTYIRGGSSLWVRPRQNKSECKSDGVPLLLLAFLHSEGSTLCQPGTPLPTT